MANQEKKDRPITEHSLAWEMIVYADKQVKAWQKATICLSAAVIVLTVILTMVILL